MAILCVAIPIQRGEKHDEIDQEVRNTAMEDMAIAVSVDGGLGWLRWWWRFIDRFGSDIAGR
jgi:hypothetical protein